jgi:hypothetical protein
VSRPCQAPLPGGENDGKVNIRIRSPIPAGAAPISASVEITEKSTPPVVSNTGTALPQVPGKDYGEGGVNIYPIPKGTKIKIVITIKDKNGTVIGSRTIDDYTVGSAGVKFGDDPPDFESEIIAPPPPPPPGCG